MTMKCLQKLLQIPNGCELWLVMKKERFLGHFDKWLSIRLCYLNWWINDVRVCMFFFDVDDFWWMKILKIKIKQLVVEEITSGDFFNGYISFIYSHIISVRTIVLKNFMSNLFSIIIIIIITITQQDTHKRVEWTFQMRSWMAFRAFLLPTHS